MSNGIPHSSMDCLAFRESLAHILTEQNKDKKVFVVGFSLGGNILANLLPDFAGV